MSHAAAQPAHSVELRVTAADIDAYQHVNNSVYLTWMDQAAWSHSAALGVPPQRCVALRRGMAAHRIEIDYLRAALAGDTVRIDTWISASDARLRVERRFRITRLGDATLLAHARVDYVCINLDSGAAARMPPLFAQAYRGPPRR